MWDQLNPFSMASKAAQGIGALTREIVEMPVHLAAAPIDVARAAGLPIPGQSRDMDWSGNPLQDIQASFRTYNPLAADIGTSLTRTANVTGIGSQKNIIGRYQDAVREGRWVDEAIEDVGNVAIVAGGVGAAAGKVASATAMPARSSALLRAPNNLPKYSSPRSLSSAAGTTTLPPALPGVTHVPLRVPGTTRIELARSAPKQVPTQVNRGKGLAGALERRAFPGLEPGELYARGSTVTRQTRKGDVPKHISGSSTAQAVADVGSAARSFSLGAQFLDPAESLVYLGERAASRGVHGLARAANKRIDPTDGQTNRLERALRRIDEAQQSSKLRQDLEGMRDETTQAQSRPQVFSEDNLAHLDLDLETRELYSGVVLDATDLVLDDYAFAWRNTPAELRAGVLRAWNARRPGFAKLSAERLDVYNDYLDGKLDPQVTQVLEEGMRQVRANELHRRQVLVQTRNLDPNQAQEPKVPVEMNGQVELIPYDQASAGDLARAIADDTIVYPWLESKTTPRLAELNESVARAETRLGEAQQAVRPLVGELEAVTPIRDALPKPGRNVPWDDTPQGRAELIDTNRARLAELDTQVAETLEGQGTESVQQSIAQAAADSVERSILADEIPDPIVGTNPTPPGTWADGRWGQGVEARADVVEGGPVDPQAKRSPATKTPAELIIEQETIVRRQLDEALVEVERRQADLDKARQRVDGFYDDLNTSQKDMIIEASTKGLWKMVNTIKEKINPNGVFVGGWFVEPDGRVVLGGAVGKLAYKTGLTGRVKAQIEVRVAHRYRNMYNRLPERVRAQTSFETFAQQQLNDAGVNIGYEVLMEQGRRLRDGTPEKKIWDAEIGNVEAAYTTQLLQRSMDQYLKAVDTTPMVAHVAYTELMSQVDHLPANLRRHVGNDFFNQINGEYLKYQQDFSRVLNESIHKNLTYVPAPFRSPLEEARRMNATLLEQAQVEWMKGTPEGRAVAMSYWRMTEHAPTSFREYVKANRAVPTHLIGGDGSGGTRVARARNNAVNAPSVHAQFERQNAYRVGTLREYSALEARELTNVAIQQSILHMANDPTFSQAAADVPGLLERLEQWQLDNGPRITFAEFEQLLKEIDPDQRWSTVRNISPDTRAARGSRLDDIILDEPVPNDVALIPGTGQILITDLDGNPVMTDFTQIDLVDRLPDVRVVPEFVREVMDDFANPRTNKYLLMYDQITQLWKTATLAWSVAWVTYNAIGNALMATFSYGSSPVAVARNIKRIRDELRTLHDQNGLGTDKVFRTAMKYDSLSAMVPTRLGAHGMSFAERNATKLLTQDSTRLGRALEYATRADVSRLGKLTEFSYTLNEFTDNLFRTSTLMEDVARRLEVEAPIPAEFFNENGTLRSDLSVPETKQLTDIGQAANAALERSTRAALNTMGDFTRLTKFERTVVKRVFPFYPWLRHQTAMAIRLPLQNPMRWMWMQSLADLLADDDQGDAMNALMANYVQTPFGAISMAPGNPFARGLTAFGGQGGADALFDNQAMLSAVNPLPKFALSQITGIDFNQAASVSRPPDQKQTSEFGQQEAGSALSRFQRDPLGGLGEMAYNALGQVSQTRGLRDAVLGPKPRYDSGDVITYADDRPGGRIASLARAARLPFIPTDIEFMTDVAEGKDREARRRAARLQLSQALSNG